MSNPTLSQRPSSSGTAPAPPSPSARRHQLVSWLMWRIRADPLAAIPSTLSMLYAPTLSPPPPPSPQPQPLVQRPLPPTPSTSTLTSTSTSPPTPSPFHPLPARSLTPPFIPARPPPNSSRHIILVLGVAAHDPIDSSHTNPHFISRVEHAYTLSLLYPSSTLIVSGAYVPPGTAQIPLELEPTLASLTDFERSRVEAVAMREYLLQRGVEEKRIVLEPYARHTIGNVAYMWADVEQRFLSVNKGGDGWEGGVEGWGRVEHITLTTEPSHAVRGGRILATFVSGLPGGEEDQSGQGGAGQSRGNTGAGEGSKTFRPSIHLSCGDRVGAKLFRLTRREAKVVDKGLVTHQDVADLNRCQREKTLMLMGW